MRILYLINGLNGGGAAFPMLQIIGLMRELGHEVTVVAMMPQDGKAAARLQQAGIAYQVIGGGPLDVLRPAWRLMRLLRAQRPQLLWTSLTRATIYGQLVGRLLRIPVVSWQHNDHLKPGNLRILRRTRHLTAHWVADSDSVHRFTETRLGVPAAKIQTWPPFVADPALPIAPVWQGGSPLRLGTLGRLHPNKQHHVLLRAFARARALDPVAAAPLELVIAGDGPERAGLDALGRELGLGDALRFVGFVEQPALFLSGLHGYVQTSFKEGFCIAAHEAMQAALPVICTRVGQLAHSVVPGRTGWLCEVGDVDALARAMLALAHDPAGAARMGHAGRERVLARYSSARFRSVGERLLGELQRLLDAGMLQAGTRAAYCSPRDAAHSGNDPAA